MRRAEGFLRGHVGALATCGGVARGILYGHLRDTVRERRGRTKRFSPTRLPFAGHCRYAPRPLAVAGGKEKGRVELAIRQVREAFFACRTILDLADLNVQVEAWCAGKAADRRRPDDPALSVRPAFAREAGCLLALPDHSFPTDWGAGDLRAGTEDASAPPVPHPNALCLALARRPNATKQPQAVDLPLPSACSATIRRVEFLTTASITIPVGTSRLGKSTIARNNAPRAVLFRHAVLFATAGQFLVDPAAIDSDSALRRRLRHDAAPALLSIDEVGGLSDANRNADLLFARINRRRESRGTLITNNRSFSEWSEIFPNAACTVTPIDLLAQRAEIIAIKGESYRRQEAQERAEQRARKRRSAAGSSAWRPLTRLPVWPAASIS